MLSGSLRRLLLLGLALASFAPVSAQEKLAWKFTSGESLKYVVEQSTEMQMSIAGQKQSMQLKQTLDMDWKIGEVASSGDASMTQTIGRVQVESDGGLVGGFKYDSSESEAPTNAVAKSMADVFSRIINKPFAVTMQPSGKIGKVDVPKELLEALAGSGGAMSEDTLKQLMTQSAVTLPKDGISKGESWENVQNVDMPVGVMTINSKLTYLGNDAKTGFAEIEMKPTISIKGKEGSPQQITLKKSEGGGKVLFDQKAGRVAQSDVDLTMELSIKQFGQQIDQQVKQKTLMKLQ